MSAKNKTSRKRGSTLPVFGVLRDLRPFLRSSQGRLTLATFLAVVLTVVEVAIPLLIGLSVDLILDQINGRIPVPAPRLGRDGLLISLAVAALLRGFLVTRQRGLAGSIGERTAARLRGALWDHLQSLPLDYVRGRGPERLLPRFSSDARAVQRLVTNGLLQMDQAVLMICGLFAGMALLNYRMALVAAAVLPILALIFWTLSRRLREESRATRRRGNRLSSYLHERLLGMPIVKAFVQQAVEEERFNELNRDVARRGARRALLAGHLQGWSAAGVALAGVVALAMGAQEAAAGRLTAGAFVAFYSLLGLLLPVLLRLAAAHVCFLEDQISVDRLISILDLDPQKAPKSKAPDLKVTDGEILVQKVACHLDKKTTLLPETTLRARRGALTAVIGPHGCGKTTLLELLVHFRQPSSGKILIDGQDIAGVSLKSLRSQIGLVAEESPLFDGTIRENIAYGLAADAPKELVQRAAQLAGADRFIGNLPKGLDTRVGRGANRLSRGQRRQIALARALAVNPSILLFDEPASALDPETENAFSQVLRTLARHKTVIVASRRLPPSLVPDQNFTLEPIPGGKRRQKKEGRNGGAPFEAEPDDFSNDDGD